jgi:hypothetical protein
MKRSALTTPLLSWIMLWCLANSPSSSLATLYAGNITVVNMAPENGTCFTPVWVGIHDGTFDIFNMSEPVSAELERSVEDGDLFSFQTIFATTSVTGFQTVTGSAPLCPGVSVTVPFDNLNIANGTAFYLSFVSMIVPSNDAFLANDDPRLFQLFDANGNYIPTGIFELDAIGADVWDAGSEINDELAENVPLLGQVTKNSGTTENGVVMVHPGLNDTGAGGIVDVPQFAAADFTFPNYNIMHMEIEFVEMEPGAPTLSLTLAPTGTSVPTTTPGFTNSNSTSLMSFPPVATTSAPSSSPVSSTPIPSSSTVGGTLVDEPNTTAVPISTSGAAGAAVVDQSTWRLAVVIMSLSVLLP